MNGHEVASCSPSAWDGGNAGRDFLLTNMQALSPERVCTPSFKDIYFGAVETQGGPVHTCVPVTFSVPGLGCLDLGGWVGGGQFSV